MLGKKSLYYLVGRKENNILFRSVTIPLKTNRGFWHPFPRILLHMQIPGIVCTLVEFWEKPSSI